MGTNDGEPYAEPMRLTDTEAYVYEAIATLEYFDRPATREEIAGMTGLDGRAIGSILRGLAGERLVEEQRQGDEPAYQLAHRARNIAAPDEPGA